MRKIKFDSKTINEIRNFIEEGHTVQETCNRFTLKYDTLKRVMYENDIQPYNVKKATHKKNLSNETIQSICNLYECTNIRMQDICKEFKLPDYIIQDIIRKNFSQSFIDSRKSALYRQSKLGDKNPMKNLTGENHPNYKGLVEDGNGYFMVRRPDWYTGRLSKEYVFYHHVVFCEACGLTEIPQGFVIHHIDFNKKNNDISNLCLMTISAHAKLHAQIKRLSKVQRLSVNGVGE